MATMNGTYNPATGTWTWNPDSVTVPAGADGTITVTIGLTPGSDGTIQFNNPPIRWGSNGKPPNSSVSPGSNNQTVTIDDPNSNAATTSYPFTVLATYSKSEGKHALETSDPTIINEGTG